MSIVKLRIELPTYACSFTIQIPDSCTILEVKQEISRTCPGRPRIEGQKLIWRGRFLADDEKVEAIWRSPNEPRIVHLAVHPSAWTSGPPTVQQTDTPTPTQSTPQSSRPMSSVSVLPNTVALQLPFVAAKHQEALAALTEGHIIPRKIKAMTHTRGEAVKLLESNGCSWPMVLDESYPDPTPGGLEYEKIFIRDIPYLSLKNSDVSPTPFQTHALHVLGYTFSILSREWRQGPQSHTPYTITQTIPEQQTIPNVPHINDLLQQMGLPPLRNAPDANPARIQEQVRPPNPFPIRPLLAPLFMLILRTSLLLYFVTPARKPIFGILILAWMVYEVWQPIRNNLLRQIQRNEQDARQNAAQRQAAPGQPDAAPAAPGMDNRPVRAPTRGLMETLGNMNTESEQRVLTEANQENGTEPGLGHKLFTFIGLLATTLHPAIWNQRRAVLRRREGTVRTEVNMREAEARTDVEDEEARQNEARAEEARAALREMHRRRPEWVQRYMDRVMSAEWINDAE